MALNQIDIPQIRKIPSILLYPNDDKKNPFPFYSTNFKGLIW